MKKLNDVVEQEYKRVGGYTKTYTEVDKMILRYMGYAIPTQDLCGENETFI